MHRVLHMACTDGTHPLAIALAGGAGGLCLGAAAVLIAWDADRRRGGYLARMGNAARWLTGLYGRARILAGWGRPLRDRLAWEGLRRRRRRTWRGG